MDSAIGATVATWVGVGLSGIFAWLSHRGARESRGHEKTSAEAAQTMVDIEERRVAEQQAAQQRAGVRARLKSVGSKGRGFRLILVNDGPSRAENLVMKLGGSMVKSQRVIEPKTETGFLFPQAGSQGSPPYEIEITWRDGRETEQTWHQFLSPID